MTDGSPPGDDIRTSPMSSDVAQESVVDDRYQPKPVSPWSYVGIRRRMRTMAGQLTLIGCAYLGAVAMAIAAHFVRPMVFDPYIRQRTPEANEKFVDRLQDMADAVVSADSLKEYTAGQVHIAFGILIDGKIKDHEKIVTRRLAEYQSRDVIVKLRITAATGSESQQQQAIGMLRAASDFLPSGEAVKICRYIREQARRRGRSKLHEAADQAVQQLESIQRED